MSKLREGFGGGVGGVSAVLIVAADVDVDADAADDVEATVSLEDVDGRAEAARRVTVTGSYPATW